MLSRSSQRPGGHCGADHDGGAVVDDDDGGAVVDDDDGQGGDVWDCDGMVIWKGILEGCYQPEGIFVVVAKTR